MVIPPVRGFLSRRTVTKSGCVCPDIRNLTDTNGHHLLPQRFRGPRIPGHTQLTSCHRAPSPLTMMRPTPHTRTYTTRRIPPESVALHSNPKSPVCLGIHHSTVPAQYHRRRCGSPGSRMPRHTQLNGYHRSLSPSTAIPRVTHAQTHTTCLCGVLLSTGYAEAASGRHLLPTDAPARQRKSPSEEGPEL